MYIDESSSASCIKLPECMRRVRVEGQPSPAISGLDFHSMTPNWLAAMPEMLPATRSLGVELRGDVDHFVGDSELRDVKRNLLHEQEVKK